VKKPTLILSLAAGLLGGVLSHYALVAPSVHAQAQAPPQAIRAQSFVLMNEQGEIGGTFRFDDQGWPVIQLFQNGREVARLGGPFIRPLDR
jgi:hypothetical protein